MENANVVPPDTEKLIFAVDVVRFFLNKHHPQLSFELSKIDVASKVNCYRPHVRELFNNDIENVLKDIDDTQSVLVRREFSEIKNKDGLNESSLTKYNTMFKNCNLNKDIHAGNFLTYCARIASMACLFYANGCNDALDMAVDLIKSSFPDDEEKCNSLFESMRNAALKYASDPDGEEALFFFSREPETDVSGTDDSSSRSSSTSETESASEAQNMSSSSSDESLTSLILRLNASVPAESWNARGKRKESTKILSAVSESSKNNFQNPKESASAAAAAKSSEGSIQNPTGTSSSRTHEALKCNVNTSSKIESSVKEAEQELQNILLAESQRKSSLGKRSSPRKENPQSSFGNLRDSSETEVKKPKLGLPETIVENE